jgi:hypothetical protein
MEIACPSRIAHVAVYARGAIVTRSVTLPASLPKEPVDLVVPGVTALSSPGSARARVVGSREVLTLRMRLLVPSEPVGPGPLVERVRALQLDRERLEAERAQLKAQRKGLLALAPEAMLKNRWRRVDPAARIDDALAACGIASELGAAIDAKILDADDAIERTVREQEAAELAAAQGRSADRMGAGHPTREIVARVAEGDAAGLSGLEVSYVVAAARWWPAYSVRLSDAGRRASWSLEAFVAQASGEDWMGALLSFCSASLVRDVRLPELPSLRLGRAQPTPRRGYRPAPSGTAELYAGYDAARLLRAHALPPPAARHAAPPPSPPSAPRAMPAAAADDAERTAVMRAAVAPPLAMPAPQAAPAQAPRGAYGAPTPAPAMAPARARASPVGALEQTRAPGGGGPPEEMFDLLREADTSPGFGGAQSPEIEPTDSWLEFDTLTLAKNEDDARRGRLVLDEGAGAGELAGAQTRASVAVERLGPSLAVDPNEPRPDGFDVRYDGKVASDVPSNARPHRVAIDTADGPATPHLVAVPREAASVYRENIAENPFGVALLAGPADLFVDGALLTTTALGATGPGGKVVLGLGVEPRVRVARNVRVEEGTGGLLGGTTTIDHFVTVDLASSLGHAAAIDLYERLPVTDEKEVVVELRGAQPAPARYDQADRGKPVRGGLKWTITLEAAATQRVELGYRVSVPAKSEVVGGNRRD